MIDLIRDFFSSGAFIPHGHCYLWKPGLVWLHVLSDSLISFAYYSIPLTLFYFVRKRQDLPFNWVFLSFALFITACGTSHLLEVWTLWYPTYWLSGTVKAVAAIASLYTAVILVSLAPKALALSSPAQLERANQELQREIIERHQTEVRLRQSEAALQQSEARYRAIVEDQTELICRFLPDGTLTFANQAYSCYFGRSQEDLFQQSYLPVVLEEDLAKVEGHLTRLSQANPVATITSQVIRPNGVRTQQWVTQAICNPQGQIVEIQAVGRDITELKQAEDMIARSRDFYLSLFEVFPTLIWQAGQDGRCNYFNSAWLNFTGRTLEQELSGGWLAGVHPDSREFCYTTYTQAFETRQPFEMEYRLRHCDGEYRWIVDVGRPFHDLDGNFAGYIGSCYDVHDRKQAELALQESEQRYRSVITVMAEGILVHNADGVIQTCNASAEQILGLSLAQMQDKAPVKSGWRVVHENGLPFPPDEYPVMVTLRTGNPCSNVVMGIYKPDGSLTWISINSQPLFRTGEPLPYEVVTSFSDITDRKRIEAALQQTNQELAHEIVERKQIEASLRESEQRFQAFMNHNPAACWISDTDGRLLYINPTYSRLFNLSENYVPGEIDCSIHPDEFAQEYLKNIRLVAETKEVLEAIEPGLLSDDTIREFLVYKFPTLDLHGQCLVGGIAIDITERKRAEKQIKASLKEKEILLKEIHHRVKNNLQIIYSLLRLQRRSLTDPQATASLLDSQNRIESIALIHEKLYRTGNLARVDVAEYISSVVSNLASAYSSQSRNVAINIEVEPIFLDIDRAIPCGLIINELISNALKYAFPVATAVNRLDIELHTDDDFNIQLLVVDNGIGLSENFDLFETTAVIR